MNFYVLLCVISRVEAFMKLIALGFIVLVSLIEMRVAYGTSNYPRPPQYVIISYDGSLSIPMWQATREMGNSAQADFTYFISGVYFLTDTNKKLYKGPRRPNGGRSAIGFGKDQDDLLQRLEQVHLATQEGHKMSSHVNGHFDGGYLVWNGKEQGENWTFEEWSLEFDAFHWLLHFVFENNQLTPNDQMNIDIWHQTLEGQLKGLRAPQLGVNRAMWETLARNYVNIGENKILHSYTYDSSKSAPIGTWPSKNSYGTWEMPLGYIPIAGTSRMSIAMDFNFYAYHSGAKPDPANADKYKKQMLLSYLNYFVKSYNGNRSPVNIGHHFSTWNGGAYWHALSDFSKLVCSLPEVICTTFDEYQVYMESLTTEQIETYKKAKFDILDRPTLPPEIINPEVDLAEKAFFKKHRFKLDLGEGQMGCTPEAHQEIVDPTLL